MTAPLTFTSGDDTWRKLREKCRTDLFFFASTVLGYGDKFPLREETHKLPLLFADRRTGVPELDTAPYQLILWPREVGKSSCITVARAVRDACFDPNSSTLLVNEKHETASDFLASIKQHFEQNPLLRALFPEVIPENLQDVTWSATRASLRRTTARPEPTFDSIGVGGTVTGKHFDQIIADDLISREAMENARAGNWTVMHKVNRWVNQLPPLLSASAFPFPRITFVGTRWYFDDTYDHIRKAFGKGEVPKRFRLSVRLRDGRMLSRDAERCGDLAIMVIAAIENGTAIFPEIWPPERVEAMMYTDPEFASCLPQGETILTKQGMRAIENVREGDLVWTGEGRYQPVVATTSRPYQGTLVRLWPYGQGTPVQVTANHKLWVQPALLRCSRWQASSDTFDWCRADELKRGDLLALPFDTEETPVTGVEADPDFWFLVGHFIGDGWVSRHTTRRGNRAWSYWRISHCFNKKDQELALRIQRIIQRLFQRKAKIIERQTTITLSYSHRHWGGWFSILRHPGWAQKWLPARYERLPASLQQHLIAGYWSADGCTLAGGQRVAVSVSLPWLCQLQRMLARCGVIGSINSGKKNSGVIIGRRVNTQRLYGLWIYPYKRNKKLKAWLDNGVMYRRIRKIEHIPFVGPVFNCEVAEDHSYVSGTNAVTYANCNLLNNPSNAAIATFKPEWLRYWQHADTDGRTLFYEDANKQKQFTSVRGLHKVIAVDPAAAGTGEGARNAIVVLGTEQESGKHFVLDVHADRSDPKDLVQDVVNIAQRYEVHVVHIELAGQQLYVMQWVEREARQRGYPLAVEALKPGGRNKDLRIGGLVVPFKSGDIYIHASQTALVSDEYLRYRPGAHKRDVLDALAYAMEVAPKPVMSGVSAKERSRQQLANYHARLQSAIR